MAVNTLRANTCPIALRDYQADETNAPIDFSNRIPIEGYISAQEAGVLCIETCSGAVLSEVAIIINPLKGLLQKCGASKSLVEERCPFSNESGNVFEINAVGGQNRDWAYIAMNPVD